MFVQLNIDAHAGTSASRRRTAAAGAKISVAGTSATRAVSSGSVSFAVESLWPVKEENVVVLAGAVYGLLLRVLPACVRIWFTGLRDRSSASAIENFTSSNCSTHLLADEFSQVWSSCYCYGYRDFFELMCMSFYHVISGVLLLPFRTREAPNLLP